MQADKRRLPRYVVFTEIELLSLVICVILDVSEYMVAILLFPVIGDIVDVAGFAACLVMFRLIGLISLLELVPGLDILPIFIITWLVWYLVRRRKGFM